MKVECFSDDLPFCSFVQTYHDLTPFRCTTDASGKPTFFFHVSSVENFEQWKDDYAGDQHAVAIKTFVENVRALQAMAVTAEQRGGILTLSPKARPVLMRN